jgi:hypothetical protein
MPAHPESKKDDVSSRIYCLYCDMASAIPANLRIIPLPASIAKGISLLGDIFEVYNKK